MMELQARVDSVLRRTQKADKLFCLGNVKVDLSSRQVFFKGKSTSDYVALFFLFSPKKQKSGRDFPPLSFLFELLTISILRLHQHLQAVS